MYKELEVRRGIMLLYEKAPDWRKRVNLDTLNMVDIGSCVLHQVFGGFSEGMEALGLELGDEYVYGFDLDGPNPDEFNETWKQLAGSMN